MEVNGMNVNGNLPLLEVPNYKEVFQKVCQSLSNLCKNRMEGMEIATFCMENVINSNVASNNLERTSRILISEVYEKLETKSNQSLESAFILDCCMDFFIGANLISDSIMDNKKILSATGNPSWHTSPTVGMRALNDAIQLRMMTFQILKTFFHSDSSLNDQLEDIRAETFEKHLIGRGIYEKLKKAKNIQPHFTLEVYRQLVDLTFGYNRLYAPVMFALTLAGQPLDLKTEKDLKAVLLDIGFYRKMEMDHATISREYNIDNFLTKGDLKLNWFFVKTVEILQEEGADMSCLIEYVKKRNTSELNSVYVNNGIFKHFEEEKSKLVYSISNKISQLNIVGDEIKGFLSSLVSSTCNNNNNIM